MKKKWDRLLDLLCHRLGKMSSLDLPWSSWQVTLSLKYVEGKARKVNVLFGGVWGWGKGKGICKDTGVDWINMCRPEDSPKSSPPAWSQLTLLNTLTEATHLSNEVNWCCPLRGDCEQSGAVASASRWRKDLMKIAFRLQYCSALRDEPPPRVQNLSQLAHLSSRYQAAEHRKN